MQKRKNNESRLKLTELLFGVCLGGTASRFASSSASLTLLCNICFFAFILLQPGWKFTNIKCCHSCLLSCQMNRIVVFTTYRRIPVETFKTFK